MVLIGSEQKKQKKHNVTLCVEHNSIRISLHFPLFPGVEIVNFWV